MGPQSQIATEICHGWQTLRRAWTPYPDAVDTTRVGTFWRVFLWAFTLQPV